VGPRHWATASLRAATLHGVPAALNASCAFLQELRSKLHFYNTGVGDDISSPFSPIAIIRELYKPGDFIAFKIDIDTEVGRPVHRLLGFPRVLFRCLCPSGIVTEVGPQQTGS
jgi:hypothetical protein